MRPIVGAILAGGLARRMGGGDKALLPLGGRPLLAHVIGRLGPQCESLVLSANGDPTRFAAFGWPVVPDDVPGQAGPLAGLLAVMDRVASERPDVEAIVSVAGDTPFLPLDLVARLRAAREREGARIASASSGGRTHPIVSLWPLDIRTDLRRALIDEDERGVFRFAARYAVALAEWPVEPQDPFLNVNTREDLIAAERTMPR